nr:succinylglutamate desuccinylase/aspartoacylase family protein [Luteolibacter marinus]
MFVAAVVHGDELNGLGIIRELVFDQPLELRRGVVIAVPVVNVYGMDAHSRYLPDRRDPNRCFPGSRSGSLTSRLTHLVFNEVIRQCDYGLDLHTAAVRRTNYPNIRADLDDPKVRRMARAFGCELIVHSRGAEGSLRRTACRRGIPTIVLEAGEVWKIEPGVVALGAQGARNVLKHLKMIDGKPVPPPFQVEVRKSVWVRAEHGGILKFRCGPGELVQQGQLLATNHDIFGHILNEIRSPADGIIQGLTTMPAVKPGEPVFHIALPRLSFAALKRRMAARAGEGLHHEVQEQLATSLLVKKRRRR